MARIVLVLGDGGHASVVSEALKAMGDEVTACQSTYGVVGPITGYLALGVGRRSARREIANKWKPAAGCGWVTVIHPSAIVSPSAQIGEGAQIMAGAIVQANAIIGRHAIINTGAQVDHGCRIGDFAHICPGAVLCADVTVEEGAMVEPGQVVRRGQRVGKFGPEFVASHIPAEIADAKPGEITWIDGRWYR